MNSDAWENLWRDQPVTAAKDPAILLARVREESDAFERTRAKGERKTMWFILINVLMMLVPGGSRLLIAPFDFWDLCGVVVVGVNVALGLWIVIGRWWRRSRDVRFDQSLLGQIDQGLARSQQILTNAKRAVIWVCPLLLFLLGAMTWYAWNEWPELRPLNVYMSVCFFALALWGTWNGYAVTRKQMTQRLQTLAELRAKIVNEAADDSRIA